MILQIGAVGDNPSEVVEARCSHRAGAGSRRRGSVGDKSRSI